MSVETATKTELWVKLAIGLGAMMVASWIAVFLQLGIASVWVHAMLIPSLGALTVAFMAAGLGYTLFRPPAFRRSRTIAFAVLLTAGVVGNVPLFAPPLKTSDWTTDVPHYLPFQGVWVTLAGGPDPDTNYRATTAALRWGYDFTVVREGKKFALDGHRNRDWFCYGEPVYAPVAGYVVRAEGHVVDNTPGEVNPESVFGNNVVIEVSPSEYVFVTNLKHQSLTVRAGDEVTADQVIGRCGNSGRSIEPHVHVHAQDRLDFPLAQGLPMRFSRYEADGEAVEKGMPIGSSDWEAADGQRVSTTVRDHAAGSPGAGEPAPRSEASDR